VLTFTDRDQHDNQYTRLAQFQTLEDSPNVEQFLYKCDLSAIVKANATAFKDCKRNSQVT